MAFKDMDNLLARFAKETVPGCAFVMMKDCEPIYEGYYGYADLETKAPITEHSIFRQASTTKLFTYTMMMQHYERGDFLLSDPIYEFLPEWRNTKKYVTLPYQGTVAVPTEGPITIKDVLNMSCGLPYCHVPFEGISTNPTLNDMNKVIKELYKDGHIPTLREQVAGMSQVPIMFEPGTRWQYGFGSEITGAILEVLTGKSVRRNMKERLIEPLGLKDTATLLDPEMAKRLVGNYQVTEEGLKKLPAELDHDYMEGNVDEFFPVRLNASCKDFAKFMSMLANGGNYKGEHFLGRKTIDLMRSNYLNAEQMHDFTKTYEAGYGYGLGVRMCMDRAAGNANASLGAFGWTGGSGIWAEADPSENVAMVYMHNTRPNQEVYHHMRVRAVAYGCIE